MRADGILFDKDGTLFDFGGTWNVWSREVIRAYAKGDAAIERRLADALVYDLEAEQFHPESFVIAGTNREAAEAVAAELPGSDVDVIEEQMAVSASEAPLAPAVDLAPYLKGLADKGLRLGVMTNDSEYSAKAQLKGVGVDGHFDFIAGFDSGFGAKPDPSPLLAFADHMKLDPARVVMVGDSTHDLIAGRRAGMQTVAVLTGMAGTEELAPFADAVFPDIGHITGWVDG
ncbi:HAD family hydrolase [Shimia abyssi]|uniref:phosphoglycolate phosphatase n=1 Tax=Shimia abyssi TaxID=1662395 RepID=A0A2P8FD71_9RHOB|nr:HAD family hydrolase [Shimia abyssi]PSL19653.1 phosphoglycolate phosphatase [Shimia abyssi]